jgi:hypothetical protein
MLLFYRLRNVTAKAQNTTGIVVNFGKLSLERNANAFLSVLPSFFITVFRHVTDAANREVPCITMGLCNICCYKCEAPINKQKCGDKPCLTL